MRDISPQDLLSSLRSWRMITMESVAGTLVGGYINTNQTLSRVKGHLRDWLYESGGVEDMGSFRRLD